MVDLSEFDDQPRSTDFRRANGAPMVRRLGDPEHWERYARPSGFGSDLDEESNLVNWRIDRAIEGVSTTPSLAADIATNIGRSEGAKERRERAISVGRGEEAADLGSALHAMAHRLETDSGFRAPPPYDADLAAYLTALDQAGLESTHFEVHLCADSWRAAGTADRIYKLRRALTLPDGSVLDPGTSVIGDLKTGARLDYSLPGFAIQVAVYADGCFYDVVTNDRSPLPDNLHTGYGLLVHLPVGSERCDLHWLDLSVGRIGAALVKQVRAWRKRNDFAAPFVYPESDEVAVLQSPIYDLERGFTADDDDHIEVDVEWVEAMLPWAQDRINAIGLHSEARALLLRRWPVSCPPLRAGGVTPNQLALVLDLLDTIEAAFSMPFPAGDPRLEWQRGVHRSEMDRTNEPPTKEPTP
jgi:hypothetical protein